MSADKDIVERLRNAWLSGTHVHSDELMDEAADTIVALRAEAEAERAKRHALYAALRWCVDNDGECLGDHPVILASARAALTPEVTK